VLSAERGGHEVRTFPSDVISERWGGRGEQDLTSPHSRIPSGDAHRVCPYGMSGASTELRERLAERGPESRLTLNPLAMSVRRWRPRFSGRYRCERSEAWSGSRWERRQGRRVLGDQHPHLARWRCHHHMADERAPGHRYGAMPARVTSTNTRVCERITPERAAPAGRG
jgi:hypothetical protein